MRRELVLVVLGTLAAGVALVLAPPVRAGTGVALWLGIAAAGAVVLASLLGIRRRLLRLRVGSMAAWVQVHNALGALALVWGVAHARLQPGGLLSSLLLGTLALLVLSGLVGAVVQGVVPRMMTARLGRESATGEPDKDLVRHWRRFHDAVGADLPAAASALQAAEARHGLSAPGTDAPDPDPVLTAFYLDHALPFLQDPRSDAPLADENRANLRFDALRTRLPAAHRDRVATLQQACADVRGSLLERRYLRILRGWLLLHVPLGVLVLLLTAAHVAAAVWY